MATDLEPMEASPQALFSFFETHPGVGGLGWYPNHGFVHVDVRPNGLVTWEG
ncbi:MAG: hypothetical protein AAF677_18380 [Pseudomonadota bacterium]